jgi:uncharacterized protein (TIGR03435 family)
VSVKPTPKDLNHIVTNHCRGGGVFQSDVAPLMWSLEYGYRIEDYLVFGAPSWVTDAQCRLMVQSLPEDRFKLVSHREMKETSVYLLTVAKSGSKLHSGGGVKFGGSIEVGDAGKPIYADGWTMEQLASRLTNFAGRPVIDRTGLDGKYGIDLDFSRTGQDDKPSIFTAVQDQSGLKLEPGKASLEAMAIDHIERPADN